MKVILFGATGMVGQGVLRECLLDPGVERVLTVGRSATGQRHEKLRELVHTNLQDFSSVEEELSGYDAYVTTTEQVGRAMLQVARRGAPKRVLENQDINLYT